MFRRLLACLLAVAICLPSAGIAGPRMSAELMPRASADCDCPPGKSDCADHSKACDCGLPCTMRVVAAQPAVSVAPAPSEMTALASVRPNGRAAAPPSAPSEAPFRPPRS